ncbi:hypothetical protein RsTz2092_04380 [Deferribacterales bacterium RsTz2092]
MERKLIVCSVCGYEMVEDGGKDPCPKCGATREKFTELSAVDAKKVFDADRTNDIHATIIKLSGDIERLCDEGLKIALDPKCVSVFEIVKKDSYKAKQLCRAEVAGHVKNSKW